MSTLKVGNLQHPDSNTVSIQLNSAGEIVANNNMSVVGNLGIGTSSNVASIGKLSIVHNNTAMTLGQSSISGEAAINFWSDSITSRAASNAFTLGMDSLSNGGPGAFVWNRNSSFLKFGTNNLERMRVDATGNVGISTSNPTSRLDVRGGDGTGGISGPTSNTWAAKIIMNQDNPGLNGLSVQNRWGGSEAIIFEAARGWNGSAAGYYPALTVYGRGYVTTPLQPRFFVNRSDGTTYSGTVVLFNNIEINVGSCYNASTGRFTAPIAGYYFFHVTAGNANNFIVDMRKNGTGIIRTEHNTGNIFHWLTCCRVVYLAQNDYVDVYATSGSTRYDNPWGGFGGYLIG